MLQGSTATGTLSSALFGSGTVALGAAGSALTLGASVGAGQIIQFRATGETLAFVSGAEQKFSGTLDGFSNGDQLTFAGDTLTAASVAGDSIVVTLSTGGTIALATDAPLSGSLSVSNASGIGTLQLASASLQERGFADPAAGASSVRTGAGIASDGGWLQRVHDLHDLWLSFSHQ